MLKQPERHALVAHVHEVDEAGHERVALTERQDGPDDGLGELIAGDDRETDPPEQTGAPPAPWGGVG